MKITLKLLILFSFFLTFKPIQSFKKIYGSIFPSYIAASVLKFKDIRYHQVKPSPEHYKIKIEDECLVVCFSIRYNNFENPIDDNLKLFLERHFFPAENSYIRLKYLPFTFLLNINGSYKKDGDFINLELFDKTEKKCELILKLENFSNEKIKNFINAIPQEYLKEVDEYIYQQKEKFRKNKEILDYYNSKKDNLHQMTDLPPEIQEIFFNYLYEE